MRPAVKRFLAAHSEAKWIFALFAATRAGLAAVGILSRRFLGPVWDIPYPWRYARADWLDIWGIHDSGWYLALARDWYPRLDAVDWAAAGQTVYNFFPLYPLLTRALGLALGDYFIAGIIVSNLALLVGAFFLYRLAALSGSPSFSRAAVLFLFLAPASFVYSGVFTEAVFFALAVMSFYFASAGRWRAAGAAAFFLALTKSSGILIVLPLLYLYLRQREFDLKKAGVDILYLGLGPLGLLTFVFYSRWLTGDALAFFHSQQAGWGHELTVPWQLLKDGFYAPGFIQPANALYLVLTAAALFYFFNRRHLAYWLYGETILAAHVLSGHCLNSIFRYALIIFPLYLMAAAVWDNRPWRYFLIAALIIAQALLMALWVNGVLIVV